MEPPRTPVKIQKLQHDDFQTPSSPCLLRPSEYERRIELEHFDPIHKKLTNNVSSPACPLTVRRYRTARSKHRRASTESFRTCQRNDTDDTILDLLYGISSCIVTASSSHSKLSILWSMLHIFQAAHGKTADVTDRKLLPDTDKTDFPCEAAGIFSETYSMLTPSEKHCLASDDSGSFVTELEITVRSIHDANAVRTTQRDDMRPLSKRGEGMESELFQVLTGIFEELVRLRVEDIQRRAAQGPCQVSVAVTPATDRRVRMMRSQAPSPETPSRWALLSPACRSAMRVYRSPLKLTE